MTMLNPAKRINAKQDENKMNDDLVKLLKYELGESPSIEKKAECLAQRFYEPHNFATKNRAIYHAVLARLLEEPNEGQDADENRLAEIFLELQIRAKCGILCEISKAGRAKVHSFTAALKRQGMPN
jgi:hypothetical protein